MLSRMGNLAAQLDRFLRKPPTLGRNAYVATGAAVIGDVTLGEHASVWYNAVVRGDINYIRIGTGTNMQDNAVLHLADDYPCILGDYVTVGHSAIVHACTVGNETLIGMGAVILDGAEIGEQCLIGAKSLVTQQAKIPAGSLVLGSPGRVVKQLTSDERAALKGWAEKYVENAKYCLAHNINVQMRG